MLLRGADSILFSTWHAEDAGIARRSKRVPGWKAVSIGSSPIITIATIGKVCVDAHYRSTPEGTPFEETDPF